MINDEIYLIVFDELNLNKHMLCQPKKPCFDCLTPYTVIPWNRDIFWDDYHTVKISYRYNPTCVAPNNGWENSSRPSRGLEA